MRHYYFIFTLMLLLTSWWMSAVRAVFQQETDHHWLPIVLFSKKLIPAEIKCNAFDRESLAVYLAIKHLQHSQKDFYILTDHKPLTFTLQTHHNHSPQQIRHLEFIYPFTSDIHQLTTIVADALSRVETNAMHTTQTPVKTEQQIDFLSMLNWDASFTWHISNYEILFVLALWDHCQPPKVTVTILSVLI